MQELRWYVARAKPGQEKRALENLERQAINAYYPRQTVEHIRNGHYETESEPVFPNYVMVELQLTVESWRAVNSTRGVVKLLGGGETAPPVPLPRGEVERLQAAEAAGLLKVYAHQNIKRGDSVRITAGTLAGMVGECRWTSGERVGFLLNLLGRETVVIAPRHAIKRAPRDADSQPVR